MGKVSQMENDSVFRYSLVPAADEFGIHLRCIFEWAVAESDDVLVAEMGVGGEPEVLRRKNWYGVGYGVFFYSAPFYKGSTTR